MGAKSKIDLGKELKAKNRANMSIDSKLNVLAEIEKLTSADRLTIVSFVGSQLEALSQSSTNLVPNFGGDIAILSQDDLNRLHDGSIQYRNSICAEAGGYNSGTKDVTVLLNLWNSFIAYLKTFPDTISYPDTPDNARLVQELQDAQNGAVSCFQRGNAIVNGNLQRDVIAFETAVNTLLGNRDNFEKHPAPSNRLQPIIDSTNDAQAKLDAITPYVVIKDAGTDALFARVQAAFDKALPAAKIDDIDRCRDEYIEKNFASTPARGEFQTIGAPWNWGQYSVAIVSAAVQAAANAITGATGSAINSFYRNPTKELSIGGTVNSRHCYGDAVDLSTDGTEANYNTIAKVACGQGPSWVEPAKAQGNYRHVHADWRPGGVVFSSACNKPPAPSGLTAGAVSQVEIDLSFTVSSSSKNEEGFIVERSTDNVAFAQIAQLPWATGSSVTYKAVGLTANTTYYFRVRAYNGVGGDSGNSNVASAKTAP